MVSSSNTIDLTGRPPVRRSTSGVLSIDAQCLRSGSRETQRGAADSGDPDDLFTLGEYRPRVPPASRHPQILKASHNQSPPSAPQRLYPLPFGPGSNDEGVEAEPGCSCGALLALRDTATGPAETPASPATLPLLPGQLPHGCGLRGRGSTEVEPSIRKLCGPDPPEGDTSAARSALQQV